jgi:molybdate transport system substrate-binding protein
MKTLAAALLFLLCPGLAAAGPIPPLEVFAAASLTDAFKDLNIRWQASKHPSIHFVFASSGTLAQQIEQGARPDLFVSADELWMDKLQQDKRIDPASRFDLAGNALVLVEKRNAKLPKIKMGPNLDLAPLLGAGGRLAVGDPASVPAGIYAKQALTKLGAWDSVANRLAPAENVRAALFLVERGEAPAGIVYATDARLTPDLTIAATFPNDSHDPIRYPAALTRYAISHQAHDFLAFLKTRDTRDVLEHYGFSQP